MLSAVLWLFLTDLRGSVIFTTKYFYKKILHGTYALLDALDPAVSGSAVLKDTSSYVRAAVLWPYLTDLRGLCIWVC